MLLMPNNKDSSNTKGIRLICLLKILLPNSHNQSQYAQTGETEQEAQTNFNLNDYLRQAAANDQAYTQSLQSWQQQAQTSTAQNLLAQAVQQQLQGYTGKTYAAGEQAYAPQLQTTSAPSAPDIASYMNQLTPGTQV